MLLMTLSPFENSLKHHLDHFPSLPLSCSTGFQDLHLVLSLCLPRIPEEKHLKFCYILIDTVHAGLCGALWDGVFLYQHVKKFRTKYRLSDTSGLVSILWQYSALDK